MLVHNELLADDSHFTGTRESGIQWRPYKGAQWSQQITISKNVKYAVQAAEKQLQKRRSSFLVKEYESIEINLLKNKELLSKVEDKIQELSKDAKSLRGDINTLTGRQGIVRMKLIEMGCKIKESAHQIDPNVDLTPAKPPQVAITPDVNLTPAAPPQVAITPDVNRVITPAAPPQVVITPNVDLTPAAPPQVVPPANVIVTSELEVHKSAEIGSPVKVIDSYNKKKRRSSTVPNPEVLTFETVMQQFEDAQQDLNRPEILTTENEVPTPQKGVEEGLIDSNPTPPKKRKIESKETKTTPIVGEQYVEKTGVDTGNTGRDDGGEGVSLIEVTPLGLTPLPSFISPTAQETTATTEESTTPVDTTESSRNVQSTAGDDESSI